MKGAIKKNLPTAEVVSFAPVKMRRIFEEICERIRHELAAGKLKPGDKLPAERELAEQFSVSRTAVREALRSLEIAGIVRLRNGSKGGAFILAGNPAAVTQSLRDMMSVGHISLDNLTEARVLIQEVVVRLACARATKSDFEALEANIDQTEAFTQAGRYAERTKSSLEFYKLLAAATRNPMLLVIVEAMTQIVLHFVARTGPAENLDIVASRRRFLQHVRARDVEKAVAELGTHLKRVHRHFMRRDGKSAAAGGDR